jgi:hypothetical protein
MDREQATKIIQNRLKLGHDKGDIASDLSKVLDLPPDLVSRFVDKVAGSLSFSSDEHVSKLSIIESEKEILDTLQVEMNLDQFLDFRSETDEIPTVGRYPDVSKEHLEPPPIEIESQPKSELTKEELTALVLKSLKKQQRHSDIVETVCTRTGMQWNEAQRFVAKVQTKHHTVLSKSSKTTMFIFSILFIIGGALLMLWASNYLIDYYFDFTGQGTATFPSDFFGLVLGGFIASFGIVGGGIFGLYKTLTNQQL